MAPSSTDVPHEASVAAVCARMRRGFESGRTRPIGWRVDQLRGLERLLECESDGILDAVHSDLGKGRLEGWTSEIALVLSEVRRARKLLRRWMRPRRVRTPLWLRPGRSFVVPEPLGVVLILGPWNYPVQLVLAPLVGAIAAGNCAIVKPGEVASASSSLLARTVPRYLDPESFAVVEGDAERAKLLLEERFDHIFFTGGATAGRSVLEHAARHLTPVTLELGGKSPCIVDETADLEVAARRIVWGKFLNAGQTCVAPDHVHVEASRRDELLARLAGAIERFYGKRPQESPDYGRIIQRRHYDRLAACLDDGVRVCGGDRDPGDLYIAPTVLRDVPQSSLLWQEEIFGPILPVEPYDALDEVVDRITRAPKPLALYLFSKDRGHHERIVGATSAGGVCINDVVNHLMVPELPFGGVGASGMGAYHGRRSFETFSHEKAVLARTHRPDWRVRYPPYNANSLKWLRRLLGL